MKILCLLINLFLFSAITLAQPVINFTPLESSCSSGDRTLTNVTITDASGIPTNGGFVPKVFYKKASSTTWTSKSGTMTSGTNTNSIWSFTIVMADIGGAQGDVIEYYVAAQNTATNPSVGSYPTGIVAGNMNSISTHPNPLKFIAGGLNGTYTVGAGGTFSTLASAINAYNTGCLNGPVVFSLTDGSYSVTTQLEIKNTQASATKTLTIKPANGVSVTINGNVPQQLFKITGSYITVDGDNGTASKQLTINNNNAGSPTVFGIFSAGSSNLITDVTILNTNIINGSSNFNAIHISEGSNLTDPGYFRNIKIINNSIQKAYHGISGYITTGANYGTGFQIKDNDLSATGANAIRTVGIFLNGSDGALISNNIIGNFNSTNDENDAGIMLLAGARNTIIEKNKISHIKYTGSSGWGAQGIYIKSDIADNNIQVVNNFISNISGDGYDYLATSVSNPIGIALLGNQSGTKIYHNSIHLNGNSIFNTKALSMGIYLAGGSSAEIINNIIVNNLGQKSDAPTGGFAPVGAAGIVASSKTQFTTISNNNYWVLPTGSGEKNIGRIGSTGYSTINEWQTASGETNATNIQPVFVSTDDLHLIPASNSGLDNTALAIGVTTDIDGSTRSTTTPDAGAAEFTAPCIAPIITVQPVAQTLCAGSALSLSATATGTGLNFQWRKNGTNITGATASSYTIASTTTTDAADYDVVVTGSCGTVTSNSFEVIINTAPAINTQPTSQTVCLAGNVTFNVSATGTGLTYQWRKNGINISGATNSSYTINGVTANDAANYDIVISGTCPSAVTSAAATLSITSATVINTQPVSTTECSDKNISFTISATGSGLTYQWRKNGNDISGATSNTLAINNVTATDEADYDVVVTNSCGTSVTSDKAAFSLKASTNITAQPQNVTTCYGTDVTFNVTATGSALSYQWMKNGNAINGATNSSYTINNISAADVANYSVTVNGCNAVTSNNAILIIPSANTWLGTISNDWNNAGNWCLGVPTATDDITINGGTTFNPNISANASIKNLTIASGATLTVATGGQLNLYGNLVNNGTFNASAGKVSFAGSTIQNVTAITAANIVVDGAGITLNGDMEATTALTLTNGNITLGSNNITINGSVNGSRESHIITNGSGNVISNNITTSAVIIPVAPNATSYNPVTIANGGGKNFTVNVSEGIIPAIAVNNRAINRTWTITPNSAITSNADITLQYADGDANNAAIPGGIMEIGLHNGNSWKVISPSTGVTPTPGADKKVSFQTTQFGAMVITTPGGISYPTALPVINGDISNMQLLPNIVTQKSVLKINAKKAMPIDLIITDINGRIIMKLNRQLFTGQNDIQISLEQLSSGVYHIKGVAGNNLTDVLRFIKL